MCQKSDNNILNPDTINSKTDIIFDFDKTLFYLLEIVRMTKKQQKERK